MVVGVSAARRVTTTGFCLEASQNRLKRLRFEGQKKIVDITDPEVLGYLSERERRKTLPDGIVLNDGFSFTLKLFDRWGRVGTLAVLVGRQKQAFLISTIDVFMGDGASSRYILLDAPPARLINAIDFLVDQEKSGTYSGDDPK